MKKTLKKLSLKTETIKALDVAQFAQVVGGVSGHTLCICTTAAYTDCNGCTATHYASCPFCGGTDQCTATAVGC